MPDWLAYTLSALVLTMALATSWLAWRVWTCQPSLPPEPQPFVLGFETGGMSLGAEVGDDAQ